MPSIVNTKKIILRHIIIKPKIKGKSEKQRNKRQITYRRIQLTANFS